MSARSSQRRRSNSLGSSRSVWCRSRGGEADHQQGVSSGLPQDQKPRGGKGVDTQAETEKLMLPPSTHGPNFHGTPPIRPRAAAL